MEHRVFHYKSFQELAEDIEKSNLAIPLSQHTRILGSSVMVGGKPIPNRLAAQPIEGFDAQADGSPGSRNTERYLRIARGMSGLIWMESISVNQQGRSNPSQLWITEENTAAFAALRDSITHAGEKGAGASPFLVAQLTHSGRYSGPLGTPAPQCAFHNPYIPKENEYILGDDDLERLEDDYVHAALYAEHAGFDAVDIRACHGYLINELLGGFHRSGRFGGSFENRTRFLLDVIRKIRLHSKIILAVRLNFCDGLPYPFGWGYQDKGEPQLDEPLLLVRLLAESGVSIVNVSAGIGAYSPQLIRPSDGGGPALKSEHPLEGIARQLRFARLAKQAAPNLVIVASAFTWLREYAPFVAAGGIEAGWFDCAGFGRQTIAYPSYAQDILRGSGMKRAECCTTCNGCMALIKQKGQPMRCVIKEKE